MPVCLWTIRMAGGTGVVLLPFFLACAARDKPPEVNRALVEKIEEMERNTPAGRGGEPCLQLAAAAIGDPSAEVRGMAAGFLSRKRPPGADRLLLERLGLEKDSFVRRTLVSALSGLSTASARQELRRIASGAEDPESRALAIGSLGAQEADRDVLRKALSSPDPAQRLGAGLALVRYPEPLQAGIVSRTLDKEEDERVRWVLAEALGLCSAGDGRDWTGTFCSLLLDDSFLVSMAASRVLAGLADPRCLEAMLERAGGEKGPWLARLGGARTIEAWLERDGAGFPDASQRVRLENLVLERVSAVVAGLVPQAALRRTWLRCLLLCRSPETRELRRRVEADPQLGLEALAGGVEKRKPDRSLTGAGALLLDSMAAKLPDRPEPPFKWYSPYELARVRPPRLGLSVGQGKKITLEMFLSSAPNHVSAVLHLVDRGAYAGLELRRLEDPVGVLLDPTLQSADAAAGCVLGLEASSRRILRGTIVVHPLHRGGGRLFIAGRPLPEWEGRVSVLGRILLGQRILAQLEGGREIDLAVP